MADPRVTVFARLSAEITDPQIASLVEEPSVTRTALDGRFVVAADLPAQLDGTYARADTIASVVDASVATAVIGKADRVNGAVPIDQLPALVKSRGGARPVGQNEVIFNPFDYGADGTATGDQAALDACYAAAVQYLTGGATSGGFPVVGSTLWATIEIPRGVITGDLSIEVEHLNFRGHGSLRGTLHIGRRAGSLDMLSSLHNATFVQTVDGLGVPKPMVEVHGAKRLWIDHCTFMGISGNALSMQSEAIKLSSGGQTTGQTISQVTIRDNEFRNVGYAVASGDRVELASSPGTLEHWGHLADIFFCGNQMRNIGISVLNIDCIDGAHIFDNQHFMIGSREGVTYGAVAAPTLRGLKGAGYVIRGALSNFVHLHNNRVYECGADGIYIENAQNVEVLGNQIPWAGQRVPASGVHLKYTSTQEWEGIIDGNSVQMATHSLIRIENTGAGTVHARGITVGGANSGKVWSDTTPHFYGDRSLIPGVRSQVNVSGFASDPRVLMLPRAESPDSGARVNVINGRSYNYHIREGERSATTTIKHTVGIVASSTNAIVGMCDVLGTVDSWSGQVYVEVQSVAVPLNTATYILGVSYSPNASPTVQAVEMAKMGLTTAAANVPSFTWNVSSSLLRAVAPAGVEGDFVFTIRAVGNVQPYLPQLTAGTPTVTGTTQVGQTLTGVPGTWDGLATLTYQWYRTVNNVSGYDPTISYDWEPISGATASTRTLVSADVGKRLSLSVMGRRGHFQPATRRTTATAAVVA